MTERIRILSENRAEMTKKEEIPVIDKAYRRAEQEYSGCSVKLQRAYGFAWALKEKSILIQKEDILVGFLYQYSYNVNFPMIVDEKFDPAGRASFHMDIRREVREAVSCLRISPESEEAAELSEFVDGVESWLYKHWHSGHALAGYPILLEKGFGGLLAEVEREKELCESAEEDTVLEAFRIVLLSCIDYVGRYEALAGAREESAETEEEKHRMREIRMALTVIKTRPPETFFQAIQLVWLAHEMMYCENIPSAVSIGRLDYYLYPYYKRDVQVGRLDEETAGEYIEAFFVKCSSQRKAYQNLTIGGCDAEGKCSVNALTYLCLQASKELKFDQPSLVFRWTDDMPERAWQEVLSLIREGMGFPALMYDPCCMKARKLSGIPEKECYNYSLLGCVEFAMQGQENSLTELLRLNLPKILNLMLHGGRDIKSGRSFSLSNKRKLSEVETYEELYEWYLAEIRHFVDVSIRCIRRMEKLYEKKYPLPYLSVLTEDCIRKRKDVSEGGARYNSVGFNLCGIATAADSLMAIKRLVYEKKRLTLEEYAEVLKCDYEGAGTIRAQALYHCPKYGNDREEPDRTAVELIDCVRERIEKYRTRHGGRYRLGLYSVEDHAIMGQATGATADGRKSGESLSNSMGAVQGMDREGPTALMNAVNRTKLYYAENGMVLDIRFIPSFLEEETGQRALRQLIETYFHQGGMEVQISVMSREKLLAAQKEPEKYQNLIVRVSGFSAYFVTLRKVTQDEIIKRTECGLEGGR